MYHLHVTCEEHVCRDLLHHTATHCNTLRCDIWRTRVMQTATRWYNLLQQYDATYCNNMLQCAATTCYKNKLQRAATTCYNLLQQHARHSRDYAALQHSTSHCNILQHTATYCNTLQRNRMKYARNSKEYDQKRPTHIWKETCIYMERTL